MQMIFSCSVRELPHAWQLNGKNSLMKSDIHKLEVILIWFKSMNLQNSYQTIKEYFIGQKLLVHLKKGKDKKNDGRL